MLDFDVASQRRRRRRCRCRHSNVRCRHKGCTEVDQLCGGTFLSEEKESKKEKCFCSKVDFDESLIWRTGFLTWIGQTLFLIVFIFKLRMESNLDQWGTCQPLCPLCRHQPNKLTNLDEHQSHNTRFRCFENLKSSGGLHQNFPSSIFKHFLGWYFFC